MLNEVFWIKTILVYLKVILTDNFITKAVLGIGLSYMNLVYVWNETIVNAVFMLFLVDTLLWSLKAIKYKVFSSRGFYKWIWKLVSYSILLFMWYTMNLVFHVEMFVWAFAWFLILNNLSSIAENLEELWMEIHPVLVEFLSVHKNQFLKEKITWITGYKFTKEYTNNLEQLDRYIEHIPNTDMKDLFKTKIIFLKRIILDIDSFNTTNTRMFKIHINLLFKSIWQDLEKAIFSSWKDIKIIEKFWASHQMRFWELLEQIDEVLKDTKENITEELFKQKKANIINKFLLIVMANVSDKYEDNNI